MQCHAGVVYQITCHIHISLLSSEQSNLHYNLIYLFFPSFPEFSLQSRFKKYPNSFGVAPAPSLPTAPTSERTEPANAVMAISHLCSFAFQEEMKDKGEPQRWASVFPPKYIYLANSHLCLQSKSNSGSYNYIIELWYFRLLTALRDKNPFYLSFDTAVAIELPCWEAAIVKWKQNYVGDLSRSSWLDVPFSQYKNQTGSILINSQKEEGKFSPRRLVGKERCSDYQLLLQSSGGSKCLRAATQSVPSGPRCPLFEFSLLFIGKNLQLYLKAPRQHCFPGHVPRRITNAAVAVFR